MASWITLPHAWTLQDVQAALNVIMTAVSGLGIFVFIRSCWQVGARSAAKQRPVPLSTLLTINTPGEAWETLVFLKSNSMRHGRILSQILAVVVLSLMSVLSGVLALYSTQMTHTTIFTEVDGLLAGRTDNSMADAQVTWNITQMSLNQAEFPMDQLLDYLPATENTWIYRSDQWNNSWSMTCEPTELTPLNVVLTENCTTFASKFGGATQDEGFPKGVNSEYYHYASSDYYVNSTFIKDLLVFLYAANYSDYEEVSDTYRRVEMAIGSLHVQAVPKNDSNTFQACRYGAGSVGSASYTRVDCLLTRSNVSLQDTSRIAYPDSGDVSGIPSAFLSNYFQRFKQQSMANSKISTIGPQDLLRFYQTYMITKDTQKLQPVKRKMSIDVPAVQIATAFVVIIGLLLLFICVGGVLYTLFLFRYRKELDSVPQSKLDWLLHSIIVMPMVNDFANGVDQIAAVILAPECSQPSQKMKRAQFEAAIYDEHRGVGIAASSSESN